MRFHGAETAGNLLIVKLLADASDEVYYGDDKE